MRSLAEARPYRLVLVGGGHPREAELTRLLGHADFEVVRFHRPGSTGGLSLAEALLDAQLVPTPDGILLATGSVISALRALEQHPVLRWIDPIVAPWAALEIEKTGPLRVDQLLSALQASRAEREKVAKQIADPRRAVFQLAPLGPVPLLEAAAATRGTTMVFEGGGARVRVTLAHGRFVGGRATDAAQLRTVRGLEALSVLLRLPESEVLVVNDEEDEPIGDPLIEAVQQAFAMEPTIELATTAFLRPAPRVIEGPKDTSAKPREPTLRLGQARPHPDDEPRTRLWHRPLSREWPEEPVAGEPPPPDEPIHAEPADPETILLGRSIEVRLDASEPDSAEEDAHELEVTGPSMQALPEFDDDETDLARVRVADGQVTVTDSAETPTASEDSDEDDDEPATAQVMSLTARLSSLPPAPNADEEGPSTGTLRGVVTEPPRTPPVVPPPELALVPPPRRSAGIVWVGLSALLVVIGIVVAGWSMARRPSDQRAPLAEALDAGSAPPDAAVVDVDAGVADAPEVPTDVFRTADTGSDAAHSPSLRRRRRRVSDDTRREPAGAITAEQPSPEPTDPPPSPEAASSP